MKEKLDKKPTIQQLTKRVLEAEGHIKRLLKQEEGIRKAITAMSEMYNVEHSLRRVISELEYDNQLTIEVLEDMDMLTTVAEKRKSLGQKKADEARAQWQKQQEEARTAMTRKLAQQKEILLDQTGEKHIVDTSPDKGTG